MSELLVMWLSPPESLRKVRLAVCTCLLALALLAALLRSTQAQALLVAISRCKQALVMFNYKARLRLT